MPSWWPSIGETSALIGLAVGLAWAFCTTAQRRRRCLKAALRPVGQLRWFVLNFVGMAAQVTLLTVLGLMSLEGQIDSTLLWFLLAMSCLSFMAAMSVASVLAPRETLASVVNDEEPQVEPPAPTPLRRTA